jgi:predicted Rossmann fold nucleotide-binding protein DprA/Smf involved in DNA uptake
MFKAIADIIKAVGKDPRKLWTLVIILTFLFAGNVVKSYFKVDDCSPLIKQNQELITSQNDLVNQNQNILKKNRELLDGFLHIQELIPGMKPDTVYINKTSMREVSSNLDGYGMSDSMSAVSSPMKKDTITKVNIKKTYKKSGNDVQEKIKKLIKSNIGDN